MDINVILAKLSEEEAEAIRQEIGRSIAADTAEIMVRFVYKEDPYNDNGEEEIKPDGKFETGWDWFARTPGTKTWIWLHHLPYLTEERLWSKILKMDPDAGRRICGFPPSPGTTKE
jgi:hypothetical protein